MKPYLSWFEHKGVKAIEDEEGNLTCDCGVMFYNSTQWMKHVDVKCDRRVDETENN